MAGPPTGDAVEHAADNGPEDHVFGDGGAAFVVAGKPPVRGEPGQRAFDDPTPRVHREPVLCGDLTGRSAKSGIIYDSGGGAPGSSAMCGIVSAQAAASGRLGHDAGPAGPAGLADLAGSDARGDGVYWKAPYYLLEGHVELLWSTPRI